MPLMVILKWSYEFLTNKAQYHLMNLTGFLEDDFCNEKQSHKLSAKASIQQRVMPADQDLPGKKEALQDSLAS